tara:strand:- start:5464 stop:6045 length:582 start_codon:yes stop_codon:yes gene_type:complete
MSVTMPNEIVMRSPSALIPYDRNPKTHPADQIEQLKASMREWGWTIPILIDEAGGVIAGHGRLYAASEMGLEEVPCIVASDWPEDKKRAYVIADNRLAENGAWDDGLFFSELRGLSDEGFDLALVGMDQNFSFDDFEPNLEPVTSFSDVTDKDMESASNKIDNQIQGIQTDSSLSGVEVMCPYCAETFTFSGT